MVILIVNSRFLQHPQKWSRESQLIHRRLSRTKSIYAAGQSQRVR